MDMDTEIATARRVGLGLGKIADTLDAHKGNVGNVVIDMNEVELNHCGSPMCFAGLYASITTSKEELEGKDFGYGSQLIARECGFDRVSKLRDWSEINPKLWGNLYGEWIFSDKQAYGMDEDKNLTLDILIAHLRSVSSNCASV